MVARFDDTDENGALLDQAQKHEPKSFSQRRPEGTGGLDHDLDGVRRVLDGCESC